MPTAPLTWEITDAMSCPSLRKDWRTRASPGRGKLDMRSRRRAPAAITARPETPIRSGPGPARSTPPSRSESSFANSTVHAPSTRNPDTMTWGARASGAASPLMCSLAAE